MNRTEKQALIDDLHEEFGRSPHAILVDFRGPQRARGDGVPPQGARSPGSRYRVVKNTLALRAVKDTPLEKLGAKFENTTGVAYTGTDPVALAKMLVDFAKDHPAAGREGRARLRQPDARRRGVKALSTMPSLPELRSEAARPAAGAGQRSSCGCSTRPAGQLARVLKAHQEKEEG